MIYWSCHCLSSRTVASLLINVLSIWRIWSAAKYCCTPRTPLLIKRCTINWPRKTRFVEYSHYEQSHKHPLMATPCHTGTIRGSLYVINDCGVICTASCSMGKKGHTYSSLPCDRDTRRYCYTRNSRSWCPVLANSSFRVKFIHQNHSPESSCTRMQDDRYGRYCTKNDNDIQRKRSAVSKTYKYILYKSKYSRNIFYNTNAFSSVRSKIINSFIAEDEVLCRGKFAQLIVHGRENPQFLSKYKLGAILHVICITFSAVVNTYFIVIYIECTPHWFVRIKILFINKFCKMVQTIFYWFPNKWCISSHIYMGFLKLITELASWIF